MLFVFTFVGEFGYELMNWQGVVRRFALSLPPGDRIVCCSRGHVYPLYERATAYFDIADVARFRESRAIRYWAASSRDRLTSLEDRRSSEVLRDDLRRVVGAWLERAGLLGAGEDCRFVFSSDGVCLAGCRFGATGYRYSTPGVLVSELTAGIKKVLPPTLRRGLRRLKQTVLDRAGPLDYRRDGDIYSGLDLGNNVYRRIEADVTVRPAVEKALGFSLDEPFVLVQGRRRDKSQPSAEGLADEMVSGALQHLSREVRVVNLEFSTGRWLDSYSRLPREGPVSTFAGRSFPEQACLVDRARHCLFFTEGDLGSHTYVPPFMGRDVTVVAPRSVLALESAPIGFWNRSVFRFGGQMIPEAAEEAGAVGRGLADRVLSRLRGVPDPGPGCG